MNYMRQDIIGRDFLKVEYDRSDGVYEVLGDRGCRTARYGYGCGGSGSESSREMVKHFRKMFVLTDLCGLGLWVHQKNRKWSAYLSPHQSR